MESVTGPVWLLLMPLAVWGVPGFILSRWLLPRADPLQRAVTALAAGIVTVAPTTYLVALVGRIPELPSLILMVSAAWSLVGMGLLSRAPRADTDADFALPSSSSRWILVAALAWSAVLALASAPSALETTEVWWHCPHLSSLYLLEDGRGPGIVSWDPAWQRWMVHFFAHPSEPAFGMGPVLGIQRPGNTAFMVQALSFLSSSGAVVALWCVDFLTVGFAALLLARNLRPAWLVAPLAAAFHLGARALSAYQVNENSLAMALSMAAFHLLLVRRDEETPLPLAIAAGVVFAHLAGVRPVALVMAPAALLLVRGRTARLTWMAAGVVAAAPWLTAHGQGLGNPLAHPVIGRPYPLNFPFAGDFVRSPFHPFPNLIRVPLEVRRAFGIPLLTVALAGFVGLRLRRERWVALLWLLPVPAMLSVFVVLDYEKLSYALIGMGALPWLIGAGIPSPGPDLPRRAGLLVAIALGLTLIPMAVRDVRVPLGERAWGDYRSDPRDQWSEELHREVLTGVPLGPYLGRELRAPEALPGATLLAYARPAAANELAGKTLPAGPVTIWAGLGPMDLDHEWVATTATEPLVPPGFVRGALHPDGLLAPGVTLVVVPLDAPAPAEARVRIHVRDSAINVSVVPEGDETVDEPRWITVLVVDRQHELRAGRVTVGKRRPRPFVATLWYQRGGQWLSAPRLIASRPVAKWTAEGLDLHAAEHRFGDAATVCSEAPWRLVRRGDTWAAVDEQGSARALARGKGPTRRVMTWGPRPPTPDSVGPCLGRLFEGAWQEPKRD